MNWARAAKNIQDPWVREYCFDAIRSVSLNRLSSLTKTFLKGRLRQIPEDLGNEVKAAFSANGVASFEIPRGLLPIACVEGPGKPWQGMELASGFWSCSLETFDWSKLWPDPEDTMALHRFGWVIRGMEKGHRIPWFAVKTWLCWRQESGRERLSCLAWDSYSVSERICNFFFMLLLDPPKDDAFLKQVFQAIAADSAYLAGHLEYYGFLETNNHVLNNARALIFSGAFLGQEKFFNLGLKVLFQELPRHCFKDGFFREASAHYQWVFTRWMAEVALILRAKKIPGWETFVGKVLSMLDACNRLSLGQGHDRYIPHIGDVSPDYPAEWYLGMTDMARKLLSQEFFALPKKHNLPRCGWAGLFGPSSQGLEISKPDGWVCEGGDWGYLSRGGWEVLTHAPNATEDFRSSHGHQDLFSFELAWRGQPLVIDVGRKNYLASFSKRECGILDEYHNSLLIDGKRLSFRPKSFMPASWLSLYCPQAVFSIKKDALALQARNFKRLPRVEGVERIWFPEGDAIGLRTRIKGSGRHRLALFLHVNAISQPRVTDNSLIFDADGNGRFIAEYQGLEKPAIRKWLQYPVYGQEKPCWRLEWIFERDLPWEASLYFRVPGD